MRGQGIAYRWFVEYNPLYFASALCVFAGVYLVAHGLPADDFASKVGVAGVTEAYEILLIGGAWLLLRSGQRRPAAILGLTALVFILDAAFNAERLFSHARTMSLAPGMRARVALPASVLFALAGPAKLALLARVFRLRGAGPTLAVWGITLFLLPLLPYAIEAAGPVGARQAAQLFAFWLGAPLLGWALGRGGWTPEEADGVRARRISRVAPFVVLGLYLAHATAWGTFHGLELSPAHGAPYLLAASLLGAARLAPRAPGRAELAAWLGTAASLVAADAGPSSTGLWPVSGTALLAGAALLALVRRTGLRLLLPALVCVIGGAFALGSGSAIPLPAPGPAWALLAAGALLAGAAAHRDFRCLTASAAAAGASVAAIEPSGLIAHGGIVAAAWLGTLSWLLFPELRRWLPCAAAAVALAIGAILLGREPAGTAPWFAATAVGVALIGFVLRRRSFQAVGLAGMALLAVATRAHYAPTTPLGWGVLLLGAGFVLLGVGVAVNLRDAPGVRS